MGKSDKNSATIEQMMTQIDELIELLRGNNVTGWDQLLINTKNKYFNDQDEKGLAEILVKVIGGGRGSLSDIALQLEDGTILPENKRYNQILDFLYHESKNILTQ